MSTSNKPKGYPHKQKFNVKPKHNKRVNAWYRTNATTIRKETDSKETDSKETALV